MNLLHNWGTYLPSMLGGLLVSLRLTALSLGLGLPLGLVLALGASSANKVTRAGVIALVEIGRGTPALVMLQIVYFGLPTSGLTLSAFISAGLSLALTTGAYTSEIIRGGLQAVPAGEVEASEALGMSRADSLRFVVIPQGLRIAIPALVGFSITIFQATSLAYSIALPELLGKAYSIGSQTFQYLSVLTLAGLIYAAVTVPASALVGGIESRMSRHL
jgi:polar amino acid transport system permease protein